ncbi:hypothetical protein B0I33_11411 [Prauserella shujinwangii]|uniref:Uncharacterized protein n=1 Tax=Prauserella shujinwangii TaxID=1453103 RepID=A0A2T0LKZ0_9PSEU|nr:hypothetical protein [Prauserella shujinwangii]PRX43554.1 hypothetical protein B0I33_11411 [Prauserella shujinwangii]
MKLDALFGNACTSLSPDAEMRTAVRRDTGMVWLGQQYDGAFARPHGVRVRDLGAPGFAALAVRPSTFALPIRKQAREQALVPPYSRERCP